jgi:hypothetical protein
LSAEESERQGKLNAEADMTDFENVHFKYLYDLVYDEDVWDQESIGGSE